MSWHKSFGEYVEAQNKGQSSSNSGASYGGNTVTHNGKVYYSGDSSGSAYQSYLRRKKYAEDIAPVASRVITRAQKKKDEEERTWFKKGSDSVAKRILGTGSDILEDLTAGILDMGEKTVDALAMLAPIASDAQFYQDGVYDLEVEKAHREAVDDSKKAIGKFVEKDLYDANAIARKLLSGVGSAAYVDSKIQNVGYMTADDLKRAEELKKPVLNYLEKDMEKDSVLGERSDALVQSAGQLAGQFGLSMVGVPWFVTSGVTSFGAEAENALNNGATFEEATGSAAVSAGAEILSEKLFGGDLFVGKSGSDLATKYLSANISNKALRTFTKWFGDSVGEAFEEIFSQFMGNLGSSLYREENLGDLLFSEQAMDEYLESFAGGFTLGGAMGGINALQSNASGVDFTSGLTANEQKVVQKELEKRIAEKGKVTAKQKGKIFDEVVRDMDKGRISTSTIEEVLGGDSATVSELVKNERLSESYNEVARRTQLFEADLTQYDAKQQEIVKKAFESGVLNNTNRSHEFVDIIAKISADKGVPFDFTNNAKLKESGFSVEGATVDGLVNENGITINMQSPKAWQTTVGHEVTHVLEGTEFYTELQNVLFEYAKPKGDYLTRYNTLKDRYKGVYKDITPAEYEAKINAEVTADLVGEYLFTDENFVNNLTANKNVFQKIYDEIKYLCKIVTAGSKEARDIERIKKAFDKAYKEAAWTETDTKYSMSNETDTSYMDAVKRSDTETAQRMVDEAANASGYNYRGVHRTNNDFTVFDRSKIGDNAGTQFGDAFYVSLDIRDSATADYADSVYGKKKMDLYIKMQSPLKLGTSISEDIVNRMQSDLAWFGDDSSVRYGVSPETVREQLISGDSYEQMEAIRWISNKNDIQISELLKQYGFDGIISENEYVSQAAVFDENQLKSADAITYDDNGNVIPLSERFKTENEDIRYSLSDKATNSNGYATPASDLMYAPVEENAPVSETENVAPVSESVTEPKYSVHPDSENEKPVTPAEKAQEYYRGDILNRGDVLSKLVNTGKTTMKAVNEATKQAQTLISKGAEGVKSIGEIFGRISTDGKLDKFEDYLHHLLNVDRRTLKERVGRDGIPVWGYSAEESQKRADKLAEENPEFVKAAEDVYAFNDYIMSVRVKSGKITQEQADRWKVDYPHYVPISRGGNADNYSTLLKFAEGDTTGISTLDEFAYEADRAADVHKVKVTSHNFDSLMDTMVNAAFTAHWGLAISDNGVATPVAPTQTETQTTLEAPVTDTAVENQTETPAVERPPSPDAVQPADSDSIKLMEQYDGVRGKLDDAVHWVEDNVLDNGRVFEKIDHKKGNRNLYSHWHAIRNAFSSAQYFIGKGNEANGVRALNDIYSEIKKNGLTSDFDSYLAHQRNIDGMTMQSRYGVAANRDFIKGVSAAQSYKEVLKLQSEHPRFKQWAKDIYANTGYLVDQMVEHKMLSQDMADLFKELYPHYAPMRYGKNGALESSLESMGQFITETFNSFAMNDFGLELKHTLRSEINREDMNIDAFIDRLDSGASLFDFDVNGMDEDYHTFTVYENGELKTFDITREMYMAMNQTRNWMDWKIPVLYQVNEGFRKATTELNWIFAATNGVKDPQEILWNSQHPLETYAKFLPAEAAVWSKDSKYRNYYEEYLANGGESVEYFNPNKNTFDADKGVLAYLNQKIGTGAISNLNGRIETAPRLAEYIASREVGKSVQEAMLDAAQVTVNFQAGGKLTKFLNRNGCTFLNASVQGALQHVRNITEGKQNAWKGVSALIAKGMVAGLGSELVKQINHLLWDDDDEYENLPDYIKQDYYLFGKFGDGTWLRLPKGRTNATIEEAIRQVALSSTGNDEADWDAFWKLFIENMAPNNPMTNNLLAPILEVKSNTTWYGEDLVPSRLKETRDEDGNIVKIPTIKQYDEKTDSFSIWLSEQLDYVSQKYNKALTELYGYNPNADTSTLSPKQINYLLNSYTGVIGDTLLPFATPKAESPDDSFLGKLVAPLRDKFTTDAVLNHRATEDFYDTLEAAEAKAKSNDATQEDKFKSGMLIGYNAELSDLYEKQREIQTDKSLKDSEKYAKTREIKQQINDLQLKALDALENYSIDGIYAEAGDKRYNYDSEKDTWWEVKPTLANGKDNYYYQQEQRITKDLGISYKEYWNNREMYDDFYYVAGGYDKDSSADDTIETARTIFGYERFAEYAKELKNIKADKDENGESISGSKYPKVQAYVNSLDIPDIEKKILYKMQYPNYNRYSYEIVKYLDENDNVSYDSFYKILDELGYKVDSKGYVTWW